MKTRLEISAGAIFMLSALYFFGGLESIIAVAIAAAIHELGHIAAIKAFKGKIRRVRMSASGLCMSCFGLDSTAKEIAAFIMGPVFGLVLAYIASYYGYMLGNELLCETAGISLIFSVFNLLPALPLDGGRVLFCAIPSRVKAEKILDVSGMLTGFALIIIGLYFLGKESGAAFLISGMWVLIAQTGIVKNLRML